MSTKHIEKYIYASELYGERIKDLVSYFKKYNLYCFVAYHSRNRRYYNLNIYAMNPIEARITAIDLGFQLFESPYTRNQF